MESHPGPLTMRTARCYRKGTRYFRGMAQRELTRFSGLLACDGPVT